MESNIGDTVRCVVIQANPIVGDIEGNLSRILVAARSWFGMADLLIFPECFLTGYPVEDLALSESFLGAVGEAVMRIRTAVDAGGLCPVLFGAPAHLDGGPSNSAFLMGPGTGCRVDKHQLPNYGPFDEKRTFVRGRIPSPVPFGGAMLGLLVCEDAWLPEGAAELAAEGADVLIAINGSPWQPGKDVLRKKVVADRVAETGLPIIYANQVGAQDELVFDGASFACSADGDVVAQAPSFIDATLVIDLVRGDKGWDIAVSKVIEAPSGYEALYAALVLGVRDYVDKNGFRGAMLGISGGIDSALVATIAVDALGADRVWGLSMPYRWTSEMSEAQAIVLASSLGIELDRIPIIKAVDAAAAAIDKGTGIHPTGVALENVQARIRGLTLMTLSNQADHPREGYIVLSTGNKSEVSVGYATLYGDMCGGLNVLKDVYKTDVYGLAEWRNANRRPDLLGPDDRCIPDDTIRRAPTAELAPFQRDADSLPPYDVLDGILRLMVDRWMGNDEIVAAGYPEDVVALVRRLLDRAEYKRRQGAPGPRVSAMSFGRDRRVPITNRWHGG